MTRHLRPVRDGHPRVQYEPRRGRNGHLPDCPYWHDRPADTCGICRSEVIAAAPESEPAP